MTLSSHAPPASCSAADGSNAENAGKTGIFRVSAYFTQSSCPIAIACPMDMAGFSFK